MESKNFKVVSLDGRRRKEGTKPKVPLRNGMDGRVGMCSILGRRRRKGEQTGEIKEKWISMAVSGTRFAFGGEGEEKIPMRLKGETFVKMDVGRTTTGFVYWIAITCAGGGSLMLSRMCRGKSLNRQTTKWDWHWPFFWKVVLFSYPVYHFIQITTCQHVPLVWIFKKVHNQPLVGSLPKRLFEYAY